MYGLILPELIGLLREQGVAEDDLLKTTRLYAIDSTQPFFLTSQQADIMCSNAIKLSDDIDKSHLVDENAFKETD